MPFPRNSPLVLCHISDYNNAWNKSVLDFSRGERYQERVTRRNSLEDEHFTNECMMMFGNPIQKLYYAFRDLFVSPDRL